MQACLRRTRADIIIIGLPSQLPPLTWCKIRSFQPLEPRYRWASTLSAGCLNDLILSWSSTTPLCFSRKVRGNLWQLRAAFGNSAVEAKRKGEQSSPTLAPVFNVESLGLALKNSRLREGEGQHLHPAAPVGFISQQRRGAGAKETPGELMDPLVLGETTLEVTSQRKKKNKSGFSCLGCSLIQSFCSIIIKKAGSVYLKEKANGGELKQQTKKSISEKILSHRFLKDLYQTFPVVNQKLGELCVLKPSLFLLLLWIWCFCLVCFVAEDEKFV